MHCGMVEDQGWEDRNALWGGGGPMGLWDGGRTPVHCGMLEDPNALWDGGGPGVEGLQCIVGWWRTHGIVGWWEDPNALWGAGGPQCIVGWWRT